VPDRGPAIRLDGVGKRYVKFEERAMLLRSVLPFNKPTRSTLWALHDIDFAIQPGETVGVLGRNGAGKTTLLRLLAGVTRPTVGRVSVAGRIAPLISVGVGFNREMSGRENVYVNGMLLGLKKPEIDERYDDIVRFAELEDFIDVPVKFYSSGMFMRLGFSVAIHVEPQILLVDEVLAVGDLTFQFKCIDKMRELQASGTTILLVSHSVSAIRLLCPRAIVLRHGALDFDGEVGAAVARHHELLSLESAERRALDEVAVVGGVTLLERVIEGPEGPTRRLPGHARITVRQRMRF
jgi:ABC-type polysaccharide/polyol phosphate transport system ATPase subunit